MSYKKKAFSLFELILVLLISSIVLTFSFTFAKELFQTQKQSEKIASLKIDLNSTKILIRKSLPNSKDILKYDGSTLFLDKNILLKNVSSYKQKTINDIFYIDITLDNTISQTWEFSLK